MKIGSRVTTGPHWRNRYKEEAPATGVIAGKESFYEGKTVRWLVKVDDPALAAQYTDGILAFFPEELTEIVQTKPPATETGTGG